MSVTPVREALARLSAERLVRLAPHQGYVVALPSARRLEHLYELSKAMVRLCLEWRRKSRAAKRNEVAQVRIGTSYAADITSLLREVANGQPNVALAESIASLNDQLYSARRHEPKVFPDCETEVSTLAALWNSGNFNELRLQLRSHHRARVLRADTLARLLSEEAAGT